MAKKKESEKSAQSSEVNKQDKSENNDDEPNFSDLEGFVDNVSDEGNLCTRRFQSGLVAGLHMASVLLTWFAWCSYKVTSFVAHRSH